MEARSHELKNGCVLLIREAMPEDVRAVLDYVEAVSGESDFLTFGPGEFELTEAQEKDFLGRCHEADNQLYIVGLIGDQIVSTLNFSAGRRPRVRHSGEFGLSVRKSCWGLGVGAFMLDALIDWAKATQVVKKINLHTRTDNQRAIALYLRKGFMIEGMVSRGIFLHGEYFNHYLMGLEL